MTDFCLLAELSDRPVGWLPCLQWVARERESACFTVLSEGWFISNGQWNLTLAVRCEGEKKTCSDPPMKLPSALLIFFKSNLCLQTSSQFSGKSQNVLVLHLTFSYYMIQLCAHLEANMRNTNARAINFWWKCVVKGYSKFDDASNQKCFFFHPNVKVLCSWETERERPCLRSLSGVIL